MSADRGSFGLSPEEKERLLRRIASRAEGDAAPAPMPPPERLEALSESAFQREMRVMRAAAATLGIADPFFRVHDGIASAETTIDGRRYVNFSSYDYLGLNGHPRVAAAAKAALERHGTSASASRLVSGERPVHGALERALAEMLGTEDCLVFVSGHATNVTVIGHLLERNDLVAHDALIHNSVMQGALLSGARRLSFAHNDADAAARVLAEQRPRHRHALIVIEGHYSMDGDVPELPAFVALAKRHRAALLVDEAHSLGVLGARGFGIGEHFGVAAADVDLWMGTLSKTLAGCGGYVAGRRKLIEHLRYSAPGFVYSVGMSPPVAAAALAALEVMREEPGRVRRLNANAKLFREAAVAAGLDVGTSAGFAIVPVITGSSILAALLSDALFRRGINVQPILYPAVAERAARLRFFLSAEHSAEQIRSTVAAAAAERAAIAARGLDLAALAARLAAASRETR